MIAYPDVNENSNMYTDLTEQFSKHHNVVTVAPSLNGKTEITEEGQTRVLRVKTNKLFNVNAISKGIANIKLPYQYARAIKNELKGMSFDLIISPTPPITLYSAVKSLKKRFDSKHYLILRDIFPANAKDLGIMKNHLLTILEASVREILNIYVIIIVTWKIRFMSWKTG